MTFAFWRSTKSRPRSEPAGRRRSRAAGRALGGLRTLKLEPLEERRLLYGGLSDLSFDLDGVVQTSIAPTHDQAEGIALQADGKIVAVGSAMNGQRQVFALARYNTDGSLDSSFDGDGLATTDFGGGAAAMAVAIQPDGKIVVAGYAYQSGAYQFALARYNTNGSLDTSFDGDGRVTTALGSSGDSAFALAIQSDGKIVAAGESFDGPAVGASGSDFALARYNIDGSLDTSFGQGGLVRTPIGPKNDRIEAITLIEGRLPGETQIVAAGWSTPGARETGLPATGGPPAPTDTALARYDAQGQLDPTFDGDGLALFSFSAGFDKATAVVARPDGSILIGGSTTTGNAGAFLLARVTSAGQLDATFGSGGVTQTSFGDAPAGANAIAVLNNQIVLAGFARYDRPELQISRAGIALARYDANGIADPDFGDAGRVTRVVGSIADAATAVAIQPDGRIVAAGYALTVGNHDFALVRYRDSLPPLAVDDQAEIRSGSIVIDVLANDSDPEGLLDPGSVSITLAPTRGTATVNPLSGEITYTPFDNGFGSDIVRYSVRGRYGDASNEATVTISELVPPLAFDDAAARLIPAGSVWSQLPPLTIDVLANDVAGSSAIDATTVEIIQQPLAGTVAVEPLSGIVTYDRGNETIGNDSFTYVVYDSNGLVSNIATVTIAVDFEPIAIDDGADVDLSSIDPQTTITILANDFDRDGTIDPSSIEITQQPSSGDLSIDFSTGLVTYLASGIFDTDQFRYTVRDNRGLLSNEATVTLTAFGGGVEVAPTANPDSITLQGPQGTVWEDVTPVAINVLANDDPGTSSLDPASLLIVADPLFGSLDIDPLTGIVTYTRSGDIFDPDTFSYRVRNLEGLDSNTATVQIAINFAPQAVDDSEVVFDGGEGLIAVIDLLANDFDVEGLLDPTTVTITQSPSAGTVELDPLTGVATYAAGSLFDGDLFRYTVRDNLGQESNEATVIISLPLGPGPGPLPLMAVAADVPGGELIFTQGASSVVLRYEVTALAGGLSKYDVYLDDPTNALRSYFLEGLSFTGLINQNAPGLLRVDKSHEAIALDGPGYSAATDTYFFVPFAQNLVGGGIVDSGPVTGLVQRTIKIYAGSGGGSKLDAVKIAQIVAQGDVLVGGFVSRNGANYSLAAGANRTMSAQPVAPPGPSDEQIARHTAVVALGATRLLGHPLDSALTTSFQAQILAGATQVELAANLWALPENLGRRVDALYVAILHRGPSQADRQRQIDVLALGGSENQIATELLLSNEYQATNAANATFVDALYRDLLGRAADAPGRQGWLTALNGGRSRAEVIDAFLRSAERQGRVVNQLSLQILGNPNGQPFVVGLPPSSQGDATAVGKVLLSTTEFANQALAARLSAADRAFVEALSRQLNGRPANASELGQALGSTGTSAARMALVQAVWKSTEHLAREVDALFRAILHRAVDPVGRATYVQLLASGATLDTVATSLLNSAEYQNPRASNAALVDGLYRDLLGRAADAGGRQAWINALNQGRARAEVIQAFLNSDERRLRTIDALYAGLLHRRADVVGQQIYLALWRQGGSLEAIAYGLLASDEFSTRFAR